MTHDLQNLPDLAHEGCPTASPRLRPVHGQGGGEHDAGAFVRPAQDSTGSDGEGPDGLAVEGAPLYTYTGRSANGRCVNGIGYTREDAMADFNRRWLRGEG